MPFQERFIMKKLAIGSALLAGISSFAFGSPDLVCSEINGANSFGSDGMGMVAYSFGTTICNIGDAPAPWDANSNSHPLISQSIYKLKDHQITQIGIGFVRHTTIPLSGNACGLGCDPAGSGALGAGCSDTSSSSVNGAQGLMGPRREVNAQSGEYPYPFTSINQTGDAVYKRVRVPLAEVSDVDALYFVETQIVGIPDAGFDAVFNNVAYRQVTFTPGSGSAMLTGSTFSGPAIQAWRDHGNGIGVPDEGVMINWIALPDSLEYVFLASKATELGTDHWRYDYGVYNLNGERGVRGLSVNLCDGESQLVDTAFNAPSYHDDLDGLILNNAWDVVHDETVYWTTDEYSVDPNANAVRWGTMYSFAFEATNHFAPSKGELVGIRLFGPDEGAGGGIGIPAWSPPHCDYFCHADLGGNVDGTPDGQLNFSDVSSFLSLFAAGDLSVDFSGSPDGLPDGQLNFLDVSEFLSLFAAGCP